MSTSAQVTVLGGEAIAIGPSVASLEAGALAGQAREQPRHLRDGGGRQGSGERQLAHVRCVRNRSVLTQPARLEEVVQRHQEILQLQPLTADQVGTLADIPEKPVVVEPEMIGPSDGVGEIAPQRSAQAAPESIDTSDDPGMVR